MKYKTVSQLEILPVDVSFLRKQLRMTGTDMDNYLLSLIYTATSSANSYTGRQLNRATVLAYSFFKGESQFELERGPVIEVKKVEFVKEDGTVITLLSSDFTVVYEDLSAFIFVTSLDKLSGISRTLLNAVQITYDAGFDGSDESPFPEEVVNAIALRAARMFTIPDDGVDEKNSISDNLLRGYRCPIV